MSCYHGVKGFCTACAVIDRIIERNNKNHPCVVCGHLKDEHAFDGCRVKGCLCTECPRTVREKAEAKEKEELSAMKIRIELDENALKVIVLQHLRDQLGDVKLEPRNLIIEVKSKQNYKSEWETAEYRAVYEETK